MPADRIKKLIIVPSGIEIDLAENYLFVWDGLIIVPSGIEISE